jgi:hypothetical protein
VRQLVRPLLATAAQRITCGQFTIDAGRGSSMTSLADG